jgi:hypothetical protein
LFKKERREELLKKTRKRFFVVFALFALVAVLILGYTFSKYKDVVEVSTKSTVAAKWSFKGSLTNSENSTTTTKISLADTVNSTTVKSGRIAPGTSGTFNIVIDASGSEVDIDYDVLIKDETVKPTNLYFKYQGEKYSTLTELMGSVNDNNNTKKLLSGTLKHEESQVKTYTIEWDWPYETFVNNVAQDEIDLNDSQISDYQFTIAITGTQAEN